MSRILVRMLTSLREDALGEAGGENSVAVGAPTFGDHGRILR